jgi:hypothetical protein
MDTTVVTTTPPVNMLGFSQDGFVGRLGDALEKLDKLQNKDLGVRDSILIEMGIDPEDPTTTPIVDLDASPVSDFSPAFDQITTYNPPIAPATDPSGTLTEHVTDLLDIGDPDEIVTWDPDADEGNLDDNLSDITGIPVDDLDTIATTGDVPSPSDVAPPDNAATASAGVSADYRRADSYGVPNLRGGVIWPILTISTERAQLRATRGLRGCGGSMR